MILTHLFWSITKIYNSYESFINEVTAYNNTISNNHKWKPNEVVINENSIKIKYKAKWKDKGDTLFFEVKSANKENLKMGEILFQINNKSVDFLKDTNYTYFEGLAQIEKREYKLEIGS